MADTRAESCSLPAAASTPASCSAPSAACSSDSCASPVVWGTAGGTEGA
eukprot:CAMPEP_0202913420 /NCGR_PEP_ID=MMETSP1392-20130828/60435_1 /ASSEMBLY_ACC=CAM_ASM_000868 /TAXON_ID=225041 /ORGANISM="Chlamydomonas chlamydogama, Strain SAG 11-48b" /LENGTH=48 /DNA_ID= /DNA_START= /DNA_END= /DNA_ORIENTATION=